MVIYQAAQVVAALVEEMVTREEEKLQAVIRHILVRLAKGYMDKVGLSCTTLHTPHCR